MVQAILAARPPASASEDSEQDDGQVTPYPQTSQENSSGYSTTDSLEGEDVNTSASGRPKASNTPRRRPPKRRSAVRRRNPTPPQSGDADGENGEDEEATEMEDAQEDTPRAAQAAASTAMQRRSSVTEMPPPPVPRRPVANGHTQGHESAKPTALALFGRHFGENGHTHAVGATPVAHRTRGHVRPQQSPSPPRGAAAQRRLSAHSLAGEDEGASGSEGYDSGEESVEPTKRRDLRTGSARRGADADNVQRARRQSQRTTQEKHGPPSDADEESAGESHEPRANGTVEAKSHQRQAGRTARTAKVVLLSRSKGRRTQGDDVEMQDGDASDESDEYEPDPEEEQQGTLSNSPRTAA